MAVRAVVALLLLGTVMHMCRAPCHSCILWHTAPLTMVKDINLHWLEPLAIVSL